MDNLWGLIGLGGLLILTLLGAKLLFYKAPANQHREQHESRGAVIAIAESYIFKGLVAQQPEQVAFAEHCRRTELGMNTGRSAEHLRELLRSSVDDVALDCYDLNWTVEGEQACVFYKQTLSISEQPAFIATRFLIRDACIHEIEILFYNHGMMDASGDAVAALSA